MQRNIEFSIGEYYHIYNRGVEKRNVFSDASDWERMLKLLYVSNATKPFVYRDIQDKAFEKIDRGEQFVAIGAYCLMPNHFHILVKEIEENGLSRFMEKLSTSYAMYFNKKYKRSGVLFQGTFKAEHVDNDEYLKYLFAYIHLNPVKLIDPKWKENGIKDRVGAKKYLKDYRYSSYVDHLGEQREESAILAPEEFPGYFEGKNEFQEYIEDWLTYRKENNTDDSLNFLSS